MVSSARAVDAAVCVPARRLWWQYVPALIVVALSLAYQVQQGTTTDVSWLITLSERLLDGQKAYVDFFEVNPPASILLYVPAVAVARLPHVAPEAIVKASVYLAFGLAAWLCKRILRDCEQARDLRGGVPLACLAAVYLLLPGDVFAQREHFIGMFLLPILCVLLVRCCGAALPPVPAIIAGLMAGAAVAVKPFFGAALALPLAYVLWCRRGSGRAVVRIVLAPEQLTTALVAALYAVAVYLCFPEFLTRALPMAVDVYGLYTNPHLAFLYSWNAIMWAACAALALLLAPRGSVAIHIALLGSLGCVVAMMLQARYFDYHAYPSIALALSSLALTVHRRWAERSVADRRGPTLWTATGAALTLVAFVRAMVWFAAAAPDPRLEVAVSRLSPHPRLMAISMGHGLAHPLVRRIGGTFVGRVMCPWMYFLIKRALRDATMSPQQRRLLQGYVDQEKTVVAEDIERERPDVILVSRPFDTDIKVPTWPFIDENWIKSTPALVKAFSAYAPAQAVGPVTIWTRKTPPTSR